LDEFALIFPALPSGVLGNWVEITCENPAAIQVPNIRVAQPYFYKVALLYGPVTEHL